MKKNLLATSALIAAGALVSQGALAEAKPIQIKVGGYHEQWVGFASNDGGSGSDVSGVDVQEDSEIHFKGSTTLDNGLTFGVNVQLEGNVQGDQIDESYLFVRGSFGEIMLGNENGAAYAMHYGFSTHGVTLNTGDHQNWIIGNSFSLASTYAFARADNDSAKIRWISPRMSGFQVGLSYAPEATQDDDGFPSEATNHPGTAEHVVALAANYDGKFDDVRIRVSVGYQDFLDVNSNSNVDPWVGAVGIRVGFGGFEIHGSASRQHDVSGSVENRDVIGASLNYSEGPMGVSIGAVYGQDDGVTNTSDDEQFALEIGGKYKLGPGVEARASLYYGTRDDESAADDTSGFAVVGGIKLNF